MKKITIAITAISLIAGSNAIGQGKIVLDGISVIRVEFPPSLQGAPVEVSNYHSFPFSDVSTVHDSLVGPGKIRFVSCPNRTRGMLYCKISDESFEVLSDPGDTVSIKIGVQNGKQLISYKGKYKAIQDYYQEKKSNFSNIKQTIMDAGMRAENLVKFKEKVDVETGKLRQFWESYQQKHSLPTWFREYETDAINYYDAWIRLYMVFYQNYYLKKAQEIPDDYYSFLGKIKIKNEAQLYQYEYNWFLKQYFEWKAGKEGEMYPRSFSIAKEDLGPSIGSYTNSILV